MRIKNLSVIGAVVTCAYACVTSVVAQDDLDNLLNDLESDSKPAASAPTAPTVTETKVEEPAAETKVEEPAAETKVEEPVAETKVEEPAAETKVEEPVAEAKVEEPVAETKVEAPEAKPAVAETKPVKEDATDHKIENFLDDLARAPVTSGKGVADSAAQSDVAAAPARKAALDHPDAELISDIVTTEVLRRHALDEQAKVEIEEARALMKSREWADAYTTYKLAFAHIADRKDLRPLKKECVEGMAEAKYQLAKAALIERDTQLAIQEAEEALKLRHRKAGAFIDALKGESEKVNEKDYAEIKHRRNDADYKEDRVVIRRRLRESAQYLSVGDLEKALEKCELVLRYDPYNTEAIRLRDRIERRRISVIENERESTRKGMIADVGAAWRPVYAINSAELNDLEGTTAQTAVGGDPERSQEQAIEDRMKKMMLPTISFRPPATIIDAVDYFRQASKDYDRPEIPMDQRGLNFVLQLDKVLTAGAGGGETAAGEDENDFSATDDDSAAAAAGTGDVPVIPNVNASNVSLHEALTLVCKVCKPAYKFEVHGSVVMVMPKEMTTDEFITRSYNVLDTFTEKVSSVGDDLKSSQGFGGGDAEEEDNPETNWKRLFTAMGVKWPPHSQISYIKTIGKLRVTNTAENLAALEKALGELNITPNMIEVETRFVEVSQEDLNSLGFEWLLNSDYSMNVGGKVGKWLNLKDGVYGTYEPGSTSVDATSGQSIGSVGGTLKIPTQSVGGQWHKFASGKNVGINAINGTDYSSGMRYLSNNNQIMTADGANYNDRFMKVNAFLGNADLSMILHMLSQRSDTDLLSAPKVVTRPGEPATMKVVTEYIYPQDYDVTMSSTSSGGSSGNNSGGGGGDGKILPMVEPQNFTMREVGVILEVTPAIAAEGQMINLEIKPQVVSEPTWKDYGMKIPLDVVKSSKSSFSSVSLDGNPADIAEAMKALAGLDKDELEWFNVPMEQPFFKVRSVETKISIYNGATVVMGGLITEDRKSTEDKIPFLGDIPYIGRLFRSRSEWSNKRNLLIFVTARLVDPNGRQIVTKSSEGGANFGADAKPAPDAK